MSTSGRPRVHQHLNRDSIARAALDLIDERGAGALNVRAVAADLGVGTSSLYHYVAGREAIVQDVVSLLLEEVDTSERPAETWDVTVRRIGHSLREMALRHPKAFGLVAAASVDEPPLRDYVARIMRLHAPQGIPAGVFERMWSILDAFLTGFLVLQAAALTQIDDQPRGQSPRGSAVSRTHVLAAEAFDHDLEIVIAGIRAVEGLTD